MSLGRWTKQGLHAPDQATSVFFIAVECRDPECREIFGSTQFQIGTIVKNQRLASAPGLFLSKNIATAVRRSGKKREDSLLNSQLSGAQTSGGPAAVGVCPTLGRRKDLDSFCYFKKTRQQQRQATIF